MNIEETLRIAIAALDELADDKAWRAGEETNLSDDERDEVRAEVRQLDAAQDQLRILLAVVGF